MAQVFVSLGSNTNREHYVNCGLDALKKHFGELMLSSLFESEAVGFDGDAFFNMVIGFSTEQSIDKVAATLRDIELNHGRELDAKKFSARTLDLDLLLYDDLVTVSPTTIPREEICHNAFVLWPLAEIAAELNHPIRKQTIAQLWQAFDKNSQQIEKVPLHWRG